MADLVLSGVTISGGSVSILPPPTIQYLVVAGGGGGGGGQDANGVPPGAGGLGGGGSGGGWPQDGFPGTANTGGGGGGGYGPGRWGGNGGTGVVIVRVLTSLAASATTGSPTITTVGSETVYKFTQSGTITF